jgi:hypothetical protein
VELEPGSEREDFFPFSFYIPIFISNDKPQIFVPAYTNTVKE